MTYTEEDGSIVSFSFTGPGDDCEQRNPPACNEPSNTTTSVIYSDRYTTADLQAAVTAALPSWGTIPPFGYPFGAELASADLSDAVYFIMESQYHFAFPVPPVTYYELTWVERFTPDDGGSSTDTARSYTWDGTIPSGYNPSDSSTWPATQVYTVTPPSSNGTITLHNLAYSCTSGTSTTIFN